VLLPDFFMPQTPATPAAAGTISIDAGTPGARIPASLYGIFLEEISHAVDGGLSAELIRNRGFEDARLPPGCRLENGFLVPPRTPHFDTGRPSDWRLRWDVTGETPAWSLSVTGGAAATLTLVDIEPLTAATPHSLQVDVASIGDGGRAAVLNSGFWGINVTRGAQYRLSLYLRSDASFHGPITAALESADGTVLASHTIRTTPSAVWQRVDATLTATGTDPQARFALEPGSTGRVWFDFVSLFPANTWRDRPNGLRPDLAEMIAAMKPAFIRWPGGCFAEGISIDSRPQWKKSVGRLEDREGTYSPWGYWSTDGFGYHEFLQLAEDVGADALFVINAGVSCSFRSGTFLEDDAVPGLIQDALDAIEYATGPVTSAWGALRAKHGHPAAFPLKYIEIGNEQQGARYGRRVAEFYRAIKAKHPDMKIVLSSWTAGVDQPAVDATGPIDIVDEHAYRSLHWAIEHFDSFASYKRQGWDLYIGEFATNAGVGRGNLLAMLNDAAFMMSMEKNADLVTMASYAPLLENVNHRDWPVNLIHFDSSRAYARASYYANMLFATNRPDVNLSTTVHHAARAPRPITARIGVAAHETASALRTSSRVDRVLAISGRDERTGDIVVKVVNTGPDAAAMGIEIEGVPRITRGSVTVLTSGNPLDENTFEQPAKITPQTAALSAPSPAFTHTFPPYSLTIMRLTTR
jgi:alpha-L-arabinofuranosidase